MTDTATTPTSTAALPAARRRVPAAVLIAVALAGSTALSAAPGSTSLTRPAGPLDRVVVSGEGAAGAVVAAGGRVLAQLPLVGGVSALLPHGAALPAAMPVTLDRALSVQSTSAAPGGVALPVRETVGLGSRPADQGSGVTVAVVDTGVADVPGLAGRVRHVVVDGGTPGDGLGHGTFVAGLVAGSGAGSDGRWAGVAPAAQVLDVQVADHDGDTSLVSVLRGLQAAADAGADVVNLSLASGSTLPSAVDPLSVALDRLWDDGVVVVVPSGNDGSTVSSPGDDPGLLTLGSLSDGGTAARDDDAVPAFSGRGAGKPDLVAPGASVVSLLSPGSAAAQAQTDHGLPAGYGVGSGTSFSTGVASGAAAALLAQRPGLTPDQVKDLLTGTAYRGGLARPAAGAGGLDLAAALTAKTPQAAKTPLGKARGKGRSGADGLPAADPAAWSAFAAAVLDDDAAAADAAWDLLSPQARQWAARQWAGLDDATRAWQARQWAARQWAGTPVDAWTAVGWSEQQWEARQWAARQWAARQWADADWSDAAWAGDEDAWAARHWAADDWAARQWAGDDWAARQWAARQWAARQWAARQWAGKAWSGSWSGVWSGKAWSGASWASTDWS